MIRSVIWSCQFFVLLLHGCIAPKMYEVTDDPEVVAERREKVIAWGNDDPCGRKMWLSMVGAERKRAKEECEEAFNNFVGLTPLEQNACLNAEKPKCLPLPSCEGCVYGCMFLCEEYLLIQGKKPKIGTSEERHPSVQREKHLKRIVKELLKLIALPPPFKIRGPYKKKGDTDHDNPPSGSASASASGYVYGYGFIRKTKDVYLS